MKENKINHALIFLASAFLPSLLVAVIYFVSVTKAISHNEALENGFIFALWFFFAVGVVRIFFDDEIDLRAVSFFPVAITGLALASIVLGLGNQITLLIIAGVGVVLALLIAHFLREKNERSYREYWLILITILGSSSTSLLSGLALNDQLNLINEFDRFLRLVTGA